MSKFQELYEKGNYLELLEYSRNSNTEMGNLWEIDTLLLLGQHEEAKLQLIRYSETLEQNDDPEIKFNFLHVQGILNTDTGDIKMGRSYLEQAVNLAALHDLDDFYLFRGWINLGLTYNSSGDFYKAIKCYDKALIHTSDSNSRNAMINVVYGFAYSNNNELQKALPYFEEGLKRSDNGQYKQLTGYALHGIINANCWLGNPEKAKIHLDKFNRLVEGLKNRTIIGYNKLSNAVFLFCQPRLALKMDSLELFVEILDKQLLSQSIELWTFPYILELLFIEYKISKQETVMTEIKRYLDRYFISAKKYNNIPHITISLISQAQLAGVEGEFEFAVNIISQAITTAENYGAINFVERANNAKDKLVDEFKRMEVLIKQNTTLSERLAKSNLTEYLKNAQDIIKTTSSSE